MLVIVYVKIVVDSMKRLIDSLVKESIIKKEVKIMSQDHRKVVI